MTAFEMPKIFVIAEPGRRVRDPSTGKLLADCGKWKPDNAYWRRRLMPDEADCRLGTEEEIAAAEAAAQAAEQPAVQESTAAKPKGKAKSAAPEAATQTAAQGKE